MRAQDIISKKRDGASLSTEEINAFIQGFTNGDIPDYQASAWLMAVFFRGMDEKETAALTDSLARSGEMLEFAGMDKTVVDKHSTGGVGDKTTLILLPLLAAAGVAVAKMSGRGLGHTGGTIDKLSCIPGFRTDLTRTEFMALVRETGVAIMGQSPQMTPADGKLYSLRDVTATVDSIPLIASSVMSKKIAAGAQSIVLDVKTGSGAFMRNEDDAAELARVMVAIGRTLGRRTHALITSMDQPLGNTVGNHIEVLEALETLRGEGPADLTELCLELGAELLVVSGLKSENSDARELLLQLLTDGSALMAMRRLISAQGGDTAVVDHPEIMGTPKYRTVLHSTATGYLNRLDARIVGRSTVLLGAGREKKGDSIDLLAGIRLYKKLGDSVREGEPLAELFADVEDKLAPAAAQLVTAYGYGRPPEPRSIVLARIT
ncbi:MAG: thymidine phosphorylase [Clostridiales bacterium]|nr:thymidine phosphorylase [Clostridiales bacterium]